ncbi:C-C motif chemokine 28-like [Xyrauchen texanus]|uniref:C-C motif chemokine 28-like n=1 Tax=Xyrauchen texanus TaxID=154827 RepID=UPI0022421EE7|nr:C-C motif chemokine 28-like [Xyrauchen texanus]
MELKRTSLLLLVLCAAILTSTEVVIPNCCVRVSGRIPRQMLRRVSRYEIQTKSGACDIDAVILHIKGHRPLCAHPKELKLVKKYLKKRNQKQNSGQA